MIMKYRHSFHLYVFTLVDYKGHFIKIIHNFFILCEIIKLY